MDLRQSCQMADLAIAPIEIGFPRLSQTARIIATKWADRPVRTPPVFQLDTIVQSVRHQWHADKNLSTLSSREIRWLPHVIFHPEGERQTWLARDTAFMSAALEKLREHSRAVRTLLRNVLRLWPRDVEAAPQIQRLLMSELRAATSPRLQEWRRRVQEYDLLSLDGPRKLADRLRADYQRRTMLLENAGLIGDLEQSEFLREVNLCLAAALQRELGSKEYEGLDAYLGLLAPDGALTFQVQAPIYADAMLLPFVEDPPPEDVKGTIQPFLLAHLKDPRLTQSGWISVQPSARDVMLRWMVSASLDEFFTLIARHAQRDHWTYRKAFWAAYHKRDYIARAWIILGENAESEARRRWGSRAIPAHGVLRGGNPDHCVLLLQIGDIVIAEWSHNGTCRAWVENSEHCPRLYRHAYSRGDLTANAGYEQRHAGNLYYTWQQQLAAVIRKSTGIGMTQAEYQVR